MVLDLYPRSLSQKPALNDCQGTGCTDVRLAVGKERCSRCLQIHTQLAKHLHSQRHLMMMPGCAARWALWSITKLPSLHRGPGVGWAAIFLRPQGPFAAN